MDDKELLKRMMLAYVCLEGMKIGNDGYFDYQFSTLHRELREAIITRFFSSKNLGKEIVNLKSRYRWDFLEFKQRILSDVQDKNQVKSS